MVMEAFGLEVEEMAMPASARNLASVTARSWAAVGGIEPIMRIVTGPSKRENPSSARPLSSRKERSDRAKRSVEGL